DSGSSPAPAQTVTDPRLAALLIDPAARRFYEPFLGRSLSVKAAALEVGCTLDQMLYRVRVFVRAGLLETVEEQRRKGRAIKLYRTAAAAYFVPHSVTPFATTQDRLYAVTEPYIREWARSVAARLQARGIEGTRLYRDASGQVWSVSAENEASLGNLASGELHDPSRPASFDIITTLHLSESQARDLQAALVRLLEDRWTAAASEGSAPFTLSLFFHPEMR
ncbi:helix-turn-helix domain-containing protein, partial [Deinococcus sp.]|uniref:winged helix-turn-helix domain-containing protein n=1 Tax=Deinococcus sp. TaxID=47478 RepID=UPI0025E3B01A